MKRKRIFKALLMVVLFICIGLFMDKSVTKVHAYYGGEVSDLKQAGATKNSVTVSWTPDSGAAKYRVEIKEYNGNADYRVANTVTGTSCAISGLKSGTEYAIRVTAISAANEVGYARTLYDVVTLPDKVTNLRQDCWWYFALAFDLKWDKLDGVSGYEITIYNGKNKKVKSETLSAYATSYSHGKISNSQIYTVRLRAFTNLNGQKYYSDWSEIRCFTQPRIKSAKVSSGKLNVKWGKVTGATGYDIYVSTKKTSGYKKVKSVGKNATSATISKFKKKSFNSKKTYYVYIVTKKKVGKITSKSGRLYYWNTKNTQYGYF